jgi:hypothetical protein
MNKPVDSFCLSRSMETVEETSNFLNFLYIGYRCTLDNIHSLDYRQKYDRSLNVDIEHTRDFLEIRSANSILVTTFLFILDVYNGVILRY